MSVLILILFPLLLLVNGYLAFGALIAAIVSMYVERTRPSKRPRREPDSEYTPGYEN
jgi:hypothetical protein